MVKGKGKGFPYSIPSVGPGADPGVQAVSLQVTVSHPLSGRLPLLSARPAVTSPASEHHCPLAGTKLYCLVTEAHRYEQLAQGCYAASPRARFELATCWSQALTPYSLHHRFTMVIYLKRYSTSFDWLFMRVEFFPLQLHFQWTTMPSHSAYLLSCLLINKFLWASILRNCLPDTTATGVVRTTCKAMKIFEKTSSKWLL